MDSANTAYYVPVKELTEQQIHALQVAFDAIITEEEDVFLLCVSKKTSAIKIYHPDFWWLKGVKQPTKQVTYKEVYQRAAEWQLIKNGFYHDK